MKLDPTSWAVFKKGLQGTAYYTMFIREVLTEAWIKKCIGLYEMASSEEASSSMQSTATTITSCTATPTRPTNVDVAKSRQFSGGERKGRLFEAVNTVSSTRGIQSFISSVDNGISITYKSDIIPPGADSLIKLEIFPLSKAVHMEKQQWWKIAELRTLCACSSTAKVADLTRQLSEAIQEQMDDEMQPLTADRKEVNTWRHLGDSSNQSKRADVTIDRLQASIMYIMTEQPASPEHHQGQREAF
ncbi:hypothetical protein WDU94_013686 [Cyamophila willieti]